MTGRMKPSTRYSQIAEANAQTICVPMSHRACSGDTCARTTCMIDMTVRKKPAISHQPPLRQWRNAAARIQPPGGSRASHEQLPDELDRIPVYLAASMLSPMISNGDQAADQRYDAGRAEIDRTNLGIAHACPSRCTCQKGRPGAPALRRGSPTARRGTDGPCTCIRVKMFWYSAISGLLTQTIREKILVFSHVSSPLSLNARSAGRATSSTIRATHGSRTVR